ncbi:MULTISPECIES: hypothetical protein [Dinoroseobacter]|jgi:hypothetical protein|uniref:hypothetical protein n=1 Tax=Dinoroseobacter TaxID=309512 RepID=UPI0005C5DD2C|nr:MULTISPECIES: hypothetical protein [Dinoroseobacter]MDD9717570.1 hypothetical protein [Dinoroseobacter sp. PD6]URF47309.1 hypothetical protein M8008_03165 [Dinoroseobacter shibae]URF51620.1 hypothetical protein M8007_03165 [Dinoroseobacter shibae]
MDNARRETSVQERKRRAARPWLFALIPLGFVAFVGILIWLGRPTGGPTEMPDPAIVDPEVLLETDE